MATAATNRPRVNKSFLQGHIGLEVQLVGRVIEGSTPQRTLLETSDHGQATINDLPPESPPLTTGACVEIIGRVNEDQSLQAYRVIILSDGFGAFFICVFSWLLTPLDLDTYEAMLQATWKHPDMFV